MDIKIEYDGDYPNLCSGQLFVTVQGRRWDFGDHCLASGGSAWTETEEDDYGPPSEGLWKMDRWPENFPEELKDAVLDAVNDEIPHGCCGGCL